MNTLTVHKGKKYRVKGQGLGKIKAAKKWTKRRWRRQMNKVTRGDATE